MGWASSPLPEHLLGNKKSPLSIVTPNLCKDSLAVPLSCWALGRAFLEFINEYSYLANFFENSGLLFY